MRLAQTSKDSDDVSDHIEPSMMVTEWGILEAG